MELTAQQGIIRGVLCFLMKDGKIGLALKKEKIGKGRLNGYGGGIEGNETGQEAVCREVAEETRDKKNPDDLGVHIDPVGLVHVATITFHNRLDNGKVAHCEIKVYLAHHWIGVPHESGEMGPIEWYEISKIPYHRMMLADSEWLPYVWQHPDSLITGDVYYGPGQTSLTQPSEFQIVPK